jgi:peptidoglycan/LPS O-acetylase OafA/YrhL
MKKGTTFLILSALVLISCVIWFFTGGEKQILSDFLKFGVILLILIFAIFFGIRRLKSVRNGEPAEDELSKKVLGKAAAMSYYISVYLWLAIMYFCDRINLPNHTLIGVGIVGMAVVFAVCWLVVNFTGLKNE